MLAPPFGRLIALNPYDAKYTARKIELSLLTSPVVSTVELADGQVVSTVELCRIEFVITNSRVVSAAKSSCHNGQVGKRSSFLSFVTLAMPTYITYAHRQVVHVSLGLLQRVQETRT